MDDQSKEHKIIFRAYCPICSRFLFKFVYESEFSLFFRCVNCKNVSAFQIKEDSLSTATLNRDFKTEPEGTITREDLDTIFEKGRKQKL